MKRENTSQIHLLGLIFALGSLRLGFNQGFNEEKRVVSSKFSISIFFPLPKSLIQEYKFRLNNNMSTHTSQNSTPTMGAECGSKIC